MIHPELPNVPKTEVRKKLAEKNKTKEECVVVYGLKTKFGGGKSTGFALIYTDLDSRKKYDSRKQLLRVSVLFNIYNRTNSWTREPSPRSRRRKSRAESRRSEARPKPRPPTPEERSPSEPLQPLHPTISHYSLHLHSSPTALLIC